MSPAGLLSKLDFVRCLRHHLVAVTGADKAVVVIVKHAHPADNLLLTLLGEGTPLRLIVVGQPGVGEGYGGRDAVIVSAVAMFSLVPSS
jgi:hypothetical protein